jgi:hypothetical protein
MIRSKSLDGMGVVDTTKMKKQHFNILQVEHFKRNLHTFSFLRSTEI